MKINIVSNDTRYMLVCKSLCQKGIKAQICSPDAVDDCDFLLLSVRKELDFLELKQALSRINKETVVLCGNDERISKLFNGKIIDYSENRDFVEKNAYLTAEATVSFLHTVMGKCISGQEVFVAGYGRIGSALSKILTSLGASVYAFARREKYKTQMECDGVIPAPIDKCVSCDVIINTVPSIIFSSELISKIPTATIIIELASAPYGFESMDRVVLGAGLPGKILPRSGAEVIFDTIYNILSYNEQE